LATTGATKVYRFTLAQDSALVFDNQTNSSAFTWSLSGPRGQEVNARNLYGSDTSIASNTHPTLPLVAGEYALTVNAAYGTGAYAFRLLDVASFAEIALNQQTTVSRSPTNATIGWRFNAGAGDTFAIPDVSLTGYWRVIDPFGQVIYYAAPNHNYYPGSAYSSPNLAFTTPVSGTYTLINEGLESSFNSQSFVFRFNRTTTQSTALVFNDSVSGQSAGTQETYKYTFALTAPITMVLDTMESPALRQDYIQWRLAGSGGTNLNFYASDPITLGPGSTH